MDYDTHRQVAEEAYMGLMANLEDEPSRCGNRIESD